MLYTLMVLHYGRNTFTMLSSKLSGRWQNPAGRSFFDPGPGANQTSKEILPWVHGIFLTEEELKRWIPGGVEELFSLSERLQLVVEKRGAQGCVIHRPNTPPLTIPGFSVEVRDTMGAGDVFNSAFIFSYLKGVTLGESGRFANAAGAVKVQKFGAGKNVPTLAEVDLLLQTNKTQGEGA